jgi:hypothetical protein
MFQNKITVIIALTVFTFSCNDDEVQINDSVKINYEFKLQTQQIDSISFYTYTGKINDSGLVEEATKQAEQDFSSLEFPSDISYTEDTTSITFLGNSKVEFGSTTEAFEVYDFNPTNNLITIYGDTLVSNGYDENHTDYPKTQYINQLQKYKPLIISQKNVFLGYTEVLVTKLINEKYFYRSGDQLVEPRIYYVHITSFEGRQYALKHGELNNEIAADAYKVLNPGDSLLVYHFSRIYQ